MYPRLVRAFYAGFKLEKSPLRCTSYVKGVAITLNCATMNQLFGLLQFDTFQEFYTHHWVKGHGFKKKKAFRQICERPRDVSKEKPPLCNQLTVEARIIHNMIHYCILPCIGSRNHVSYFDVFLMWCILNDEKLDLAYLIIHHMRDCTKRKGVLPYGMLLTAIFEFFGVPLDDETDVVAPKPTDVYSEATLRRMGFELDEEENIWVRNKSGDEEGDKEAEAEEEDEDEDNESDG